MSTISASPEELRGEATHVQNQAAEMQSLIQGLTTRLGNLTSVFTGQAQTKFDATYTDWSTSARQMMDSLDSLGKFLNTSADAIEQTDAQLAQGLGG